jgi:hypothetical protein
LRPARPAHARARALPENTDHETRIASALIVAALLCPVAGLAQTAQVVQQDKTIDVAKFKTYSYEAGHPAILKEVDQRILAALEAQLTAKGLEKVASGPADAIVSLQSFGHSCV